MVTLIPKENKDLHIKENYRPICLLPVWGRVVDKLIINRLMAYLENSNILDSEQYGLRKNLSTIHALKTVKNYIDLNLSSKKLVCMLSLDIKIAFNSIHKNSILAILDEYIVPNKLELIISDYLRNIIFIANELLRKSKGKAYKMVMYADDIIILLSSTASFHFTDFSKEPIDEIVSWCKHHHLTLSINKCCFPMFKKGKSITHIPRIIIQNTNIKYIKELKYLGLTFDTNLTWILHMNKLK